MARYNITNSITCQIMFGGDYPSFKACVQDAARLGVPLWGANLANQDLSTVSFVGCEMQGVNFSGSNLSQCDLTDADLSNANLTGANVTSAVISDQTNFFGASTSGTQESIQIDTTATP